MNDHEDTNGSKKVLENKTYTFQSQALARIMKNAIPQTGKVMQRRNVTRLYFQG